MSGLSQDDATNHASSSHHLVILSIMLACPLGCAMAAAPPRIHPTPGPDASCAISGRNDPHARGYTAVVLTAEGGSAFEDRAVCLEERPLAPAEPPVEIV